ncbi:hypothetical protein RRG08_033856 [Elysia crispata]|uniref:Uncharacterized protein n=1 Tax=Elysia crispata TaxID=231223 RepID=A0AAE1B8D9_9GAST|nr:hypothetical protein RRG08_033856 [Elysia crispata]
MSRVYDHLELLDLAQGQVINRSFSLTRNCPELAGVFVKCSLSEGKAKIRVGETSSLLKKESEGAARAH